MHAAKRPPGIHEGDLGESPVPDILCVFNLKMANKEYIIVILLEPVLVGVALISLGSVVPVAPQKSSPMSGSLI